MSSLRLLLGLIPSTSKIEQAEKALTDEYEKLKAFAKSELLDKYLNLHELVNSSAFVQKKKEIESLKYKNSEEYAKEKEFLSMQKAKDIIMYFKTVPGSMLKRFKELDGSAKIRDFEELENFIKSNAFRQRQKMKPITFKDTDEYRKFIEYKSLRKDQEIKAFLKAKKDLQKTKAIERFEELEKFIRSFLARNLKAFGAGMTGKKAALSATDEKLLYRLGRNWLKKYHYLKANRSELARQKQQLEKAQQQIIRSAARLQTMHPQKFEYWVAGYFQKLGYMNVTVTQYSADFGIDIYMTCPNRRKAVVQVKRYSGAVGRPVIQQTYGAMHLVGAKYCYVVTSGEFASTARELEQKHKDIILVDGKQLVSGNKKQG